MSCNRTVPFNIPPCVGDEIQFVQQAVEVNHKIAGDGLFTKKCNEWLESRFNSNKILLITSGTSALEMAAILCDLKPGDEVILPSFTFTSTATAFVLAGAKLVFVDIRPDTMNIDETKIESAITERTRVIVPVHYAGVACEMDTIMDIARRHNLLVVEDAAQAVIATYKGRALGTIGDFGCYSFHETKNYSMGEGGAISINNSAYCDRAEIIREKGTNRAQFFRGQVAKYNWSTSVRAIFPPSSTQPICGPSSSTPTKSTRIVWQHGEPITPPLNPLRKKAFWSFRAFPRAVSIMRTCFISSCAIWRPELLSLHS